MSSHKPRRPRWPANPLSLQRVVNRLEPFTQSELLRLELPIRLSYQAFLSGQATVSDFHDLVAAMNSTLVRSEAIGPECEAIAKQAADALRRTWDRYEHTGRLSFDTMGAHAMGHGIELHEELIRNSSPEQMVRAMREVLRRCDQQRAAA
jgi:hypothetical protein